MIHSCSHVQPSFAVENRNTFETNSVAWHDSCSASRFNTERLQVRAKQERSKLGLQAFPGRFEFQFIAARGKGHWYYHGGRFGGVNVATANLAGVRLSV